MRELRFEYPDDLKPIRHLIEYSCDARTWDWTFDGDVVASCGQHEFPGRARGSWGTTSVEIELPRYAATYLRPSGQYGVLIDKGDCARVAAADGSWKSDDVWVRNVRRDADSDVEYANLHLYNVATGDPDAATSSHGLVIGGAGLGAYSWSLPNDRDGRGATIDGNVTTLFGRRAILRDIPTGELSNDLLVAYDGEPFEKSEQVAVWIVLTFLAGTAGLITASLSLDGNVEVGRRVYAWQRPKSRPQPPILLTMFHPLDLGKEIPAMCEAARASRRGRT